MKWVLLMVLTVFVISVNAQAQMYEWKDDRGVINFTDNPENIPAKYRKRVKKRPSISGEESVSTPQQGYGEVPQAAETTPINQGPVMYGGHDEDWWRSRFNSLRDELKSIQNNLPSKNEQLEAARRKLTIYSYPRYRQAYYELLADIEKDNARIKELNNQLESLDNEASRAGVPFDWRQ